MKMLGYSPDEKPSASKIAKTVLAFGLDPIAGIAYVISPKTGDYVQGIREKIGPKILTKLGGAAVTAAAPEAGPAVTALAPAAEKGLGGALNGYYRWISDALGGNYGSEPPVDIKIPTEVSTTIEKGATDAGTKIGKALKDSLNKTSAETDPAAGGYAKYAESPA